MFWYRETRGPVELAFTDRWGGASPSPFEELNLALHSEDSPENLSANLDRLRSAFAPQAQWAQMNQVHGSHTEVATPGGGGEACASGAVVADALVTGEPNVVLMVRVADCLPILLEGGQGAVLGAVHAGRQGLRRRVIASAVEEMQALGAQSQLRAWIGPHICAQCYEVSADLQAQTAEDLPGSPSLTRWGTPGLDLAQAARAQLAEVGVDTIETVPGCTLENSDLYSYRRDSTHAGRQVGLIWRRP